MHIAQAYIQKAAELTREVLTTLKALLSKLIATLVLIKSLHGWTHSSDYYKRKQASKLEKEL